MIFEVCRWLKDKTRDWQVIQADTLDLAARHEAYCVAANKGLDAIANRAEIQDEADAILAQIRSGKCGEPQPDGHFYLTRTQLTDQFASNPGRHGAMTPERLYSVIIPDLIKRGLAKLAEKHGKLEVLCFVAMENERSRQQREFPWGEVVEMAKLSDLLLRRTSGPKRFPNFTIHHLSPRENLPRPTRGEARQAGAFCVSQRWGVSWRRVERVSVGGGG